MNLETDKLTEQIGLDSNELKKTLLKTSVGSVLRIKFFYEHKNVGPPRLGTSKNFTLNFGVLDVEEGLTLFDIKKLVTEYIMANLGAIMSVEMRFSKFSIEDLLSGTKTGVIRVSGCWGSCREPKTPFPFEFEIIKSYPPEEKRFILYGVPSSFASWDNPHDSFSRLREAILKFSEVFLKDTSGRISLRCVGIHQVGFDQGASSHVTSCFPLGFKRPAVKKEKKKVVKQTAKIK